MGYCGISPVTLAINNGTPIKIVASVNQEGSGFVVGNDRNINSAGGFKGKTIAIPQKNPVPSNIFCYISSNSISRCKTNGCSE